MSEVLEWFTSIKELLINHGTNSDSAPSDFLGYRPLHVTSIRDSLWLVDALVYGSYQFDWLLRHYAIVVEVLVVPPLRILISVSADCCPFLRASWSEIISPVSWVSTEWTESRRVCWLFSQSWALTISSGKTVLWNIRITNLKISNFI